jgi:hypothetical protein
MNSHIRVSLSTQFTVANLRHSVLVTLVLFILPSYLEAQIVVPRGWENMDSVRISGANAASPLGGSYWHEDSARIGRIQDSLGNNVVFDMSYIDGHQKPLFSGRVKGYDSYYANSGLDMIALPIALNQRIYYPSPEGIWFNWGGPDGGYRWRYVDTVHYSWHNNTYDTNDVSPYAQFEQDTNFVKQTYLSKMEDTASDTTGHWLKVGNHGRMILGYSDLRRADQMLMTTAKYDSIFPSIHNLAKAFSARLEFNIDTTNIFSSDTSAIADNVPILRVQILFKRGKDSVSSAKSILPFVPFKRIPYGSQAGWFAVIDTIITPSLYHNLRYSWRVPDTLTNGLPADSFKFKQMNLQFRDLSHYIDTLIQPNPKDDYSNWGIGTGLSRFKDTILDADTYVAMDSTRGEYIPSGSLLSKDAHLIEIRILSTYRAKLRIRSLSWQDTTEDKFLYRARFTDDSTHSLNPDGNYGGYDDTLAKVIANFKKVVDSSGCKIRNMLINDVSPNPVPMGITLPGIAYLDYMLSKSGLHTLFRPQEYGGTMSQGMRRERLSYDGIPPSIMQNQTANFYSQRLFGWRQDSIINHVFPGDYIPSAALGSGKWLSSSLDTMQGLLIARPGDTTDYYKAYRIYTETEEMQGTCESLRQSSYVALHHNAKKKQSIESSPQIWGLIYTGADSTGGHWVFHLDSTRNQSGVLLHSYTFANSEYAERPTTPEENNAFFYISLANGISSFNIAQFIDNGGDTPFGCSVTLFGVNIRRNQDSAARIDYSYNYGWRRSPWAAYDWLSPTSNYVDSVLPKYYLGYANQFRAMYHVVSRINQIYDTTHGRNEIPFRRFTWLDAYSTHKAIQKNSNTDTVGGYRIDTSSAATYRNAFLKCFSTTQVKLWNNKDSLGNYKDSLTGGGGFVADSGRRTYAEVGLFKDSINVTTKNYAALVVNTRLYPDHKTGTDSTYYCQGLASQDQPHSLFGDVAVRRVWFTIDTNQMDPSSRSASYLVHDLWKPDSVWLVTNDTVSVYIKPGDAKFLYFEPGNLKLGEMTDNLYNNARHIAAIDTSVHGIKQYVATYARNGSIVVSYPIETPTTNEKRKAGTPVDSVIVLDTLKRCHNPAIAYNHKYNTIGLTYRKVFPHSLIDTLPGAGHDTTWICYQQASYSNPYHFSPVKVLDTILTSYESTTGYKSLPAIAPRDTSYIDSMKTGEFWVAYNHPTGGGVLHLVDTNGNTLRVKNFWPPDSQVIYVKFVSIATHIPYDSVHIAFEEGVGNSGQIYYTKGYLDGTSALQITTNPALCISNKLNICQNHCPQIGITPNNILEVVWESVNLLPYRSAHTLVRHNAVLRSRGGSAPPVGILSPGSWGDYTSFSTRSLFLSLGTLYTDRIYVNISSANVDENLVTTEMNTHVAWEKWPDAKRLMWNNIDSGNIELARYGDMIEFKPVEWDRYTYTDPTQEPALPTLSFGDSVSHNFLCRSIIQRGSMSQNANGLYDARMPLYNFPLSPTGNGQSFMTITALPQTRDTCRPFVIVKVGNVKIQPSVGLGKPIPLHGLADSSSDPNQFTCITWDDKRSVRSYPFHFSSGDTLKYQREFHVGAYQAGDTAAAADSLKGSSDYIRARIYLRRATNDSILAILDSAMLKQSGFVQTGSLHDSCWKRIPMTFSDSTYISMELSRGDTTNGYLISRVEAHDDYFFGAAPENDSLSYKKETSPFMPGQSVRPPNQIKVSVIPNPFSTSTLVSLDVPKDLPLNVTLFDVLGKVSLVLSDNLANKEHYEFTIHSGEIPQGSYFLRIQSGSEVITRKIQLVK